MTAFLGIDVGLTGAVAALSEDGRLLWAARTPTVAGGYHLDGMLALLQRERDPFVALEDVGAARVAGRTQGGTSMFTFGKGAGIWVGLIFASGLPRIDVKPQAWTRSLLAGMPRPDDPKERIKQRKANAVQRALALWPSLGIRFKADWPMADAALIAEHARRLHVGALAVPTPKE